MISWLKKLFERGISIQMNYTFEVFKIPTYLVRFGVEICELSANSLCVVRKFDALVAAESWCTASSHCLGPGDCARRDDWVQDASRADGSGFSDDRVDGDGFGDCSGWNRETQARASLGDVWRRELNNAVGNGREILALERCWEGLGRAKAAGGCSAIQG